MPTHRILPARWREVIAAALIACSGKVGGSYQGPSANEAPDGGPSRVGLEGGAAEGLDGGLDGGTDAPNELDTGLDGGSALVYGPADPDASNWCAGGVVGGARPVAVRTPAGYECGNVTWPLVILLHDYGSSGPDAEAYFQIAAQADSLGFLYAHPDGTRDSRGNEFWNATDACCNVDHSAVDDSSYLDALIASIRIQYNADRNRVFVFGHGNGGFMAYRLACDHAADVTAVADFGGATWASASECPAKAPISALEIHGTSDPTFLYDGGMNLGAAYPSAPGTIDEWIGLRRCDADAGIQGAGLELLEDDAGTDTTVVQWPCILDTQMALWSIQGGTHQPTLASNFTPSVLEFLLAQTKP